MTITAALVLFAVIWFMLFLMILPQQLKTQGDIGEIVPGTHSSAPTNPQIKRKAKITTAITLVLWAITVYIILSGKITVRDFDWMNMLG
jgi:predicted secreted protein